MFPFYYLPGEISSFEFALLTARKLISNILSLVIAPFTSPVGRSFIEINKVTRVALRVDAYALWLMNIHLN